MLRDLLAHYIIGADGESYLLRFAISMNSDRKRPAKQITVPTGQMQTVMNSPSGLSAMGRPAGIEIKISVINEQAPKNIERTANLDHCAEYTSPTLRQHMMPIMLTKQDKKIPLVTGS